jgi:hypothetical protein
LLAGIVAAPLTWLLIALGQSGSARTVSGWVASDSYNVANLIEAAAYLLAGGIVLGLLGTLRLSPAGPLAAGLLLVGPALGMFVKPFAVRDAIPGGGKLLGEPLSLRLPLDNGTLLLIGTMLLMATFSLQRWRRWPAAGTGTAGEAATESWVDGLESKSSSGWSAGSSTSSSDATAPRESDDWATTGSYRR